MSYSGARTELHENIARIFRKNRPNITDSSIKTYSSILATLFKATGGASVEDHFNKNYREIVRYIEEKYPKASAIKTRMAAIISFIDNEEAKDYYREVMNRNVNKVKEQYASQEKTETEKENWIEYEDIVKTHEYLKDKVNAILNLKGTNLSMNDIQEIQQYVILSLYTVIKPRRTLDYILCKYRNYDEDTDNYLDRSQDQWVLYFNKYKTAYKHGKQKEEVPTKLKNILKNWIKILDGRSDYLLVDRKFEPLSATQMNQRLNKIFGGRKISVNMIRHSYLTKYYENMPKLAEMQETAKAMGHDVSTALSMYVKKD